MSTSRKAHCECTNCDSHSNSRSGTPESTKNEVRMVAAMIFIMMAPTSVIDSRVTPNRSRLTSMSR